MDTVIVIGLLLGSLLMIFGGLLGHSLSQRLLAGDLRHDAELRREIGEHRREIAARCPRCGCSPRCAARKRART